MRQQQANAESREKDRNICIKSSIHRKPCSRRQPTNDFNCAHQMGGGCGQGSANEMYRINFGGRNVFLIQELFLWKIPERSSSSNFGCSDIEIHLSKMFDDN